MASQQAAELINLPLKHLTVNDTDSTFRPLGNIEIMGYHNDSIAHFVELSKKLQHLSTAVLVERTGRLVSKEK